jgi:hypothetical protein
MSDATPRDPLAHLRPGHLFSIKGTRSASNRARVVQDRASYFDGKMPMMFMPGQASGMMSPGQLNDRPARWPEAGQLCRIPRVVFLSVAVPPQLYCDNFTLVSRFSDMGLYGHHDVPEAWAGITGSAGSPEGSQMFVHGGGYTLIDWLADPHFGVNHDLIGWFPEHRREIGQVEGPRKYRRRCVIDNPIRAEYDRLVAACLAAKRVIEATYAGHVWVQVCQFLPREILRARYEGIRGEMVANPKDGRNLPLHAARGPLWILGPDTFGGGHCDHFAGTDFLHVYMGMPAIGREYAPPRSTADALGHEFCDGAMIGHDLSESIYDPGNWEKSRTSVNCPKIGGGPWDEPRWGRWMDFTSASIEAVDRYGFPRGKLAKLREGRPCFHGYRAVIHPIAAPFAFPPPPSFLNTTGARSRFPRGDLKYDDQDWVESYHFQGTLDAMIRNGDRERPDVYSPTWDGDTHPYNVYFREPPNDWYEPDPAKSDAENAHKYNVRLQERYDAMIHHLGQIEPKTAAYFETMLARHGLSALGFEVGSPTSAVSAGSIAATIIRHFRLDGNATGLPNIDFDTRKHVNDPDPDRDYPMSNWLPIAT